MLSIHDNMKRIVLSNRCLISFEILMEPEISPLGFVFLSYFRTLTTKLAVQVIQAFLES